MSLDELSLSPSRFSYSSLWSIVPHRRIPYDKARIGRQTSLLPDTEVFCSSLGSSEEPIRSMQHKEEEQENNATGGSSTWRREGNRIRRMCSDSVFQSFPSDVSQELVFRSGEVDRMTLLHSVPAAELP